MILLRPALGLLLAAVVACGGQAAADIRPAPELDPVDVIRLQLQALRDNEPANNQGIATAYRFASPRNRAAVGSLDDFTRMLQTGYSDMLIATGADVALLERRAGEAAVRATLTLPDGSRNHYVFVLQRYRSRDCDGCWLTEGVMQGERERESPPLQTI